MTDRQRHDNGDDRLARKAGELLRADAEALDAASAGRLARARRLAVAELEAAHRSPSRIPGLLPAASAAVLGALAIGLWLNRTPSPVTPPVASAADLDLLLAEDNLEMLEDLEFYAWIDPELTDAELAAELESAT